MKKRDGSSSDPPAGSSIELFVKDAHQYRMGSRQAIPAAGGRFSLAFSVQYVRFLMKYRSQLLCAALLAAAFGAQAQTRNQAGPLYGELGYSPIKIKYADTSVTPKVLRAMVGYELSPNLAIEGMLGMGVSDDSTKVGSVSINGEVDHTVGIYLKPKAAITPDLEVFGRLGYARSKLTFSALGMTESDSSSDASYGLGFSYRFDPKISLTVDYMSYYNKNGWKANGLTVGVGFRF